MKKIKSFLISLFPLVALSQNVDTSAYKFILDYAVPASPAFTALDVTPQQVTRGSASKPLLIHAFTNFLQTGKLDPGIAADFSPYLLFGGGFKNLDEYRTNPGKRILANTTLSAAALKNSKDSVNTDVGLGIRITLIDNHDLFTNSETAKKITNNIGSGLAAAANARVIAGEIPEDEIGTDGDPTGTVPVDLSRFYTDAYNSISKEPGFALSLGFGYRTTIKSSTVKSDSLFNKQSRLWLSATRYTAGGFDIYGVLQGTFADSVDSKWIAGIALGSKNKLNNVGAELTYDFSSKEWNYGANFEIKILKQFSYIISLGKRSLSINGVDISEFRIISNLRLNLFGH